MRPSLFVSCFVLAYSVFFICLFPLEDKQVSQIPLEQNFLWIQSLFKMWNQGRTMNFFNHIYKYIHLIQDKKNANVQDVYQ